MGVPMPALICCHHVLRLVHEMPCETSLAAASMARDTIRQADFKGQAEKSHLCLKHEGAGLMQVQPGDPKKHLDLTEQNNVA